MDHVTVAWGYLAIVAVMSSLTFVAYALDKRRARRSGWRISELKLHAFELLGGWPGAILARSVFRHKTRKLCYRLVFFVIVVIHGCLIAWWMLAR